MPATDSSTTASSTTASSTTDPRPPVAPPPPYAAVPSQGRPAHEPLQQPAAQAPVRPHAQPAVAPPGFPPPRHVPAPGGWAPAEPATPRRPPIVWRERIPELAAGVGALLVALAVTGFLASTWEHITDGQKAMAMAVAAAGLTAGALWGEANDDRWDTDRFGFVIGATYGTATLLVAAATSLGLRGAWPQDGRLVALVAGLAAAAHAGVALRRRPHSLTVQVSLFAALAYAVGPFGTSMGDTFDSAWMRQLTIPIEGLFDPFVASDAFVVTGVGHLALGVAWLGLARVLSGRAAHLANVLATLAIGAAALELNVLVSPLGSLAALLIVVAFLGHGLVTEERLLVVGGSVGVAVAGVRVLTSLFSGEVLVTVLVFAIGLALLAWALRAMSQRATSSRPDAAGTSETV